MFLPSSLPSWDPPEYVSNRAGGEKRAHRLRFGVAGRQVDSRAQSRQALHQEHPG